MIIEYLTNAYKILNHCEDMSDNEDMWRQMVFNIKPFWQYCYCKDIHDRKEVWQALANSKYLGAYRWREHYWRYVKKATRDDRSSS